MVEPTTEVVYDEQSPVLVLRTALLRVVSGPDEGLSCELRSGRVLIGSGADSALQLHDSAVSRHHLEVRVLDRGYLVRDLQSTNGTFFRGARIGDLLVGLGSEFRVGQNLLRIEKGAECSGVVAIQQRFGSLIGTSKAMQKVYGLLAALAPSDVTVLLHGETGSGKDLAAEELHRQSARHRNSFGVLDCSMLPDQLAESELFGHERGAFTGAERSRQGVFERHHRGTVFIDEIGELPAMLQAKLLRVIDRRTVRRVGGDLPRPVDVRLVAATHRDLLGEVRAGRFREDLYYRLAVVKVELPPLRERKEDIAALARHFLRQTGCGDPDSVLSPALLGVLESRRWPGNVRELRNVIERAAILNQSSAEALSLTSTPGAAPRAKGSTAAAAVEEPQAQRFDERLFALEFKEAKAQLVEGFERQYCMRLVQRHGDNISAIARSANLARFMVRRLLDKYGLRNDAR